MATETLTRAPHTTLVRPVRRDSLMHVAHDVARLRIAIVNVFFVGAPGSDAWVC